MNTSKLSYLSFFKLIQIYYYYHPNQNPYFLLKSIATNGLVLYPVPLLEIGNPWTALLPLYLEQYNTMQWCEDSMWLHTYLHCNVHCTVLVVNRMY